ncbi:cell division cycle-associated protein 3 [Gouania willdenowi]|uniref:Cell division cycle-associated protein 3 n=1 Tax=Gouania willdenowi TaxID=441366 RepID=A0A8C5HGI9_GOUWI|nr:cell division cycle-associated protein 3 [Gouania willdenowi]
MGSSESKMGPSEEVKPELAIKKNHVSHLVDPRSPSTGIDRTPIQVNGPGFKTITQLKSESLQGFTDPRSPSVGITRTPVREVMRATVGSFARRLGMIFHHETENDAAEGSQKHTDDTVERENLASTKPLLTPQRLPRDFGSLAEHAKLLATPVNPTLQTEDNQSPFVLLEEPQVEVEIETEVDISLDEAEEAKESPLRKRMSMSLIAYHEGTTSSHVFAEEQDEHASTAELKVEPDHCYALPSVEVKPESSAESCSNTDVDEPLVESLPEEKLNKEPSLPAEASPSDPPTVPSPEIPQECSGIRCPTFDSRSPSQVVFKPQWLGKGFGASGLRSRGLQGQRGKGGSSPLAVSVAVKNATNENKAHHPKLKQRGSEGRSPLQIIKGTNSPREQLSQTKGKVSTPEKQRLRQMDQRVLAVSLNKENR